MHRLSKWLEIASSVLISKINWQETPGLLFKEVVPELFEFDGEECILLVDYYSKFIEVDELKVLRF